MSEDLNLTGSERRGCFDALGDGDSLLFFFLILVIFFNNCDYGWQDGDSDSLLFFFLLLVLIFCCYC